MSFKDKYSFYERVIESHRILSKYPTRVPIICERSKHELNCPKLDKMKYLVPKDLTNHQFMYVIKKRLTLSSDQALFLFVHTTVPQSSQLISDLYESYKDTDGFLYITYASENTFGYHVFV